MKYEEWMNLEETVLTSAKQALDLTKGQLSKEQEYTLKKLADNCARPMADTSFNEEKYVQLLVHGNWMTWAICDVSPPEKAIAWRPVEPAYPYDWE